MKIQIAELKQQLAKIPKEKVLKNICKIWTIKYQHYH
jgi:hypothetical protein